MASMPTSLNSLTAHKPEGPAPTTRTRDFGVDDDDEAEAEEEEVLEDNVMVNGEE